MPLLQNNETYTVRGTMDLSSGTTNFKSGSISRSTLTQEVLAEVGVSLFNCRVWNNYAAPLPTTAALDDLGLVGTWATDAKTLQTINQGSNGAATSAYAVFDIVVGNEFDTGETMQVRFRAGMVTAVADATATIDLVAYVNDGDGAIGSDLCTTAAQTINSLTKADKDFTINTASLAHGDVIECRVDIEIEDAATGTVIGEISQIQLVRDIKG